MSDILKSLYNKQQKNKKHVSRRKAFEICCWVWLCLCAVASLVILALFTQSMADTHLIFNIACFVITLCFVPYYFKKIIEVMKNTDHSSRENTKSIMSKYKRFLSVFPNLMLCSLLPGFSYITGNVELWLCLLSALILIIGIILCTVKSLFASQL